MMDYGENGYLHSKMWAKYGGGEGGGVGIKMSWVEKNLKINNWGGDDYLGLKSKLTE